MEKKICQYCNISFPVIRSWNVNKFCSRICFCKSRKGIKRPSMAKEKSPTWKGGKPNCIDCKKQIRWKAIRCKSCNYIAHSKENAPNWKGGTTSISKLEREKFFNTIRNEVLKRDNYTCQMCEAKKDLQVDHIQSWAEYVELRFSMDNCRTLCRECHYSITYNRAMPKGTTWGLRKASLKVGRSF